MRPAEEIEKLVKNVNVAVDPKANKRVFGNILHAFNKSKARTSAPAGPNIGRTIMKTKMSRFAAAAAVILVAGILLHSLGGPDMAGVAWADLAERVRQIQTCIFRGHTTVDITGPREKTVQQEFIVYVSSDHGFRADSYMDEKLQMTQYMLPEDKVIISVMPAQKKYIKMLLTEELLTKMGREGKDPREMVNQFMKLDYTELGRDTIDGVEVEGIETTDPNYSGGMFENFRGRLWVDVETDLPVRMEMDMEMEMPTGDDESGLMQMSMVLDSFEWEAELEPSLFEPNIPDDYTKMAEVQMPGMDEGSAVKGLRVFAELTDGNYPASMNPMKIAAEASKALMLKAGIDKESLKDDPNNAAMQEAMQEMMSAQSDCMGACMFYMELANTKKDPAYYGDRVTAEDTDAVLMRWKISENEYRVIFGDLTTENVTAEQLTQLENALPQ